MFPISLLSFSRNKQGFRLSLEKTLEVPVLLRVNTEHTSLSLNGWVRHTPTPCKAIAANEIWGPGWYESSPDVLPPGCRSKVAALPKCRMSLSIQERGG